MLIQIITVDDGRRPPDEVSRLGDELRARDHDVAIHRFAAASSYRGRSGDAEEVVQAIWASDRACFAHARRYGVPWTLVMEEDCELTDADGIAIAESFVASHPGEVDLFFLGASPNCWWTPTQEPRVIRYSHAYWWHAVIFTRAFMDRYDVPRTWKGANDIHFSRLIAAGEVRAYGLRRQVAFQRGRRNRFAETALYPFRWGDGRRIAGAAMAGLVAWLCFRFSS